jgi:hypothetical protein
MHPGVAVDLVLAACADYRYSREPRGYRQLLLWYKKPPPTGLYAYHRNRNLDFDAAWIR